LDQNTGVKDAIWIKSLYTGVNFKNIFRAPFLYEIALRRFSLVTAWLVIFWHKNIGNVDEIGHWKYVADNL